jgi:predicted nucleic acid-binding Zn ribbon protein
MPRRNGFQRLDVKGCLRAWEMHRAGRARGATIHDRWASAAGPDAAAHSRPRSIRNGVLRVVVDTSALLQELAAFRKPELISRLNADNATPAVIDIRFEIGKVT